MPVNWDEYQEVSSGPNTEFSWPEKGKTLKPGDSIEGRYIAKKENVGPNKSNIYVLEVNGQNVGVWGSTVIDSRMESIAIGKMVAIEYRGEEQGKNNRTYKNYKIGQGVSIVGDEDPFRE